MAKRVHRVAVVAWELGTRVDIQTGQRQRVLPDASVLAGGANQMYDVIAAVEGIDGEPSPVTFVLTDTQMLASISYAVLMPDEVRAGNVVDGPFDFAQAAEEYAVSRGTSDDVTESIEVTGGQTADIDIRIVPSEF